MSVDRALSIQIVRGELDDVREYASARSWHISNLNEVEMFFTVNMKSPIDGEEYILKVTFDNYKEMPLLLEFIDPHDGKEGVKRAYPKSKPGKGASFFHDHPCICNPCNRKAYETVHKGWKNMAGWETHEKISSLTNIGAILKAVFIRISKDDLYSGRMSA